MMCYGLGYLLRDVQECPVSWQPYTVGDTISPAAVTVSTWKDGTPLYFVTTYVISDWYIGYLLPSAPRTFFMRISGSEKPHRSAYTRVYLKLSCYTCCDPRRTLEGMHFHSLSNMSRTMATIHL